MTQSVTLKGGTGNAGTVMSDDVKTRRNFLDDYKTDSILNESSAFVPNNFDLIGNPISVNDSNNKQQLSGYDTTLQALMKVPKP